MNKLKIPRKINKNNVAFKKGDSLQDFLSIHNSTEEFLRQGTTKDSAGIEDIKKEIVLKTTSKFQDKGIKRIIKPVCKRNQNILKSKKNGINQSFQVEDSQFSSGKFKRKKHNRGGSTKRDQ